MLNESAINLQEGKAMGNRPERCNLAVFVDEQRNPCNERLGNIKISSP